MNPEPLPPYRAVFVPANEEEAVRYVELPNPKLGGTDRYLDELYRLIGVSGLDSTAVASGVTAWVDDEGLLTGAPVNRRLCEFRDQAAIAAGYRDGHPSPYPLVGNAVLVGGADDDGDETPVPAWVGSALNATEEN